MNFDAGSWWHRWRSWAGGAERQCPRWRTIPAAPFYDATKRVEAQGPVTKFLFKNPHSFLYFEATDDKGQKVEWQVELGRRRR